MDESARGKWAIEGARTQSAGLSIAGSAEILQGGPEKVILIRWTHDRDCRQKGAPYGHGPCRYHRGSTILSDEERAEMAASLKAAETRIAAGQYVEHDPARFVDRLMDVRAAVIRNGKA